MCARTKAWIKKNVGLKSASGLKTLSLKTLLIHAYYEAGSKKIISYLVIATLGKDFGGGFISNERLYI